MRYMLIDSDNNVVAELKSEFILPRINEISVVTWRGKNYIYSYNHRNGEYEFFQEAGEQVAITDAAVEIRK